MLSLAFNASCSAWEKLIPMEKNGKCQNEVLTVHLNNAHIK